MLPKPLAHTVEWLTRFQVYTPRAERYATLSGWTYPIAPLPELELAYDIHAFFRIYDDFTDDLTADLGRINVISAELTGILLRQAREIPDGNHLQ